MRKIIIYAVVIAGLLMTGLNANAVQSGKDTTQTQTQTQTKKQTQTQQKDTTTAPDTSKKNDLQIDTSSQQVPIDTQKTQIDTAQLVDSTLIAPVTENKLTNFKLFLYIVLSILGLALFYYIFVQMLFKTFHKTRSTRQSMMLSWNLFFTVSIVWLFIIWGIVGEFWSSAAFMVTMIFLFIVSLVMVIISVKSK
ncbi:MAG: hypothetical protein KDC73_13070 [Ignavibacteriae bacterium]|nr:hypothetical protein [Ignavibacteriota bacterium]MCB9242806.1 hypothetical protein [Ignavibacteriales bacterium]